MGLNFPMDGFTGRLKTAIYVNVWNAKDGIAMGDHGSVALSVSVHSLRHEVLRAIQLDDEPGFGTVKVDDVGPMMCCL